jgi:hypothetical protein
MTGELADFPDSPLDKRQAPTRQMLVASARIRYEGGGPKVCVHTEYVSQAFISKGYKHMPITPSNQMQTF